MRKTAAALAGLLVMGTVSVSDTYNGYEIPPYSVVKSIGAAELRDYGPHVVARVTVEGGRAMAANRGFRTLANYIFGGNGTGEKIAMTAPVAQEPTGDQWTVSFMMPAQYTMDTLPTAQTQQITFVQKQGDRQLVLQFSGLVTGRLDSKGEELLAIAQQAGLQATGPVRYYFYDDPLTAPWNRRNEVAVSVAP